MLRPAADAPAGITIPADLLQYPGFGEAGGMLRKLGLVMALLVLAVGVDG